MTVNSRRDLVPPWYRMSSLALYISGQHYKPRTRNKSSMATSYAEDFNSFSCVTGICRAGRYSTNNGVCPCKLCPYGTYQENEQWTTCKACPTGTNTTSTGSTSIDDCVGKSVLQYIMRYLSVRFGSFKNIIPQ